MCRWMGSHLHDWSDYDGVAFSLKWGRTFGFFGGRQFLLFLVSNLLLTYQNMFVLQIKSKVFFIQSKKWVNS